MPFKRAVLEGISGKVSSRGADAYITFDSSECFYLSGLKFSFSVCAVINGELFLFTDRRYLERAKGVLFKVIEWEGFDNLLEFLKGKSLIVDGSKCTVSTFNKLSKLIVKQEEGFIDEFRAVKSEEELSLISKAVSIAEVSLRSVLHLLKPGITEKEFRAELVKSLFLHGSDGEAFPTIVASGPNSSIPHWETSDRRIEDGDCVIVDFGAVYRGYVSDITRTFFVGKPPSELLEIYDAVLKAQSAGISSLKPGVSAKEVDSSVRNFLKSKGFDEFFLHSTGHGIGIDVHEKPTLSRKSTDTLGKNMVVTVEPGVYISGLGGVRIEDDCIVTEDGSFTISNLEK